MPLKPWTVINSTVVHQTPWLEIVADECEVDGHPFTYTYSKRRDPGPMVIAEDDHGKLWLVKQYRHGAKKIIWQFVAEGRPPEESWLDAAKRGLYEELHKEAANWTDLGELYPDPGGLEQVTRVFLAQDVQESSRPHYQSHENEQLEIAAFSLDEIEKLINQGEICDGWTLGSLYLYRRWKARKNN